MQARRRHAPPPWDRRRPYPRHPIGRMRRRWPHAYGEDMPVTGAALNPRYRRAYDGGAAPRERRRRASPTLRRIRQSPVRHGLVGLAIAGAAAPVAITRYQQALKLDPSHERVLTQRPGAAGIDERRLMERWQELNTGATGEGALAAAEADRETLIQQSLERYADYNLTRELAETIYDTAVEAGVDPELAFGLVRAESSFRNQATSPVGAIGLTQLMPRTAAWMEPGVRTSDLRNPETNLRVGFKYLSYLLEKYRGNEDLALLAYNRGPGTVDRILRRGGNPDNGYAAFVRGEEGHGHTLYSSR